MDEYQLEIRSLRSTLDRLRAAESDLALIDEYEGQLRNLNALYDAARDTFVAGERDQRLRAVLTDLGFGEWTLENVYSFVYEAALDTDVQAGRELASQINETDYAASLLAAFEMG